MADNEQTPALPDQQLILRAICDPGSFTKRGDYQGEPYGETVQRWSMRAVQQVIGEWLAGRTVLELPPPKVGSAGETWWPIYDGGEVSWLRNWDDDSFEVETPHERLDLDCAEAYGLALVAAAREARRLASESSRDEAVESGE